MSTSDKDGRIAQMFRGRLVCLSIEMNEDVRESVEGFYSESPEPRDEWKP